MPARLMLSTEVLALRTLSVLDQMESDWMSCVETDDPIAIAKAVRSLGLHLLRTMRDPSIGDGNKRDGAGVVNAGVSGRSFSTVCQRGWVRQQRRQPKPAL